jgi:hypothetical protein
MLKDRDPEEILGESGLLKELTKRFVELALEGLDFPITITSYHYWHLLLLPTITGIYYYYLAY